MYGKLHICFVEQENPGNTTGRMGRDERLLGACKVQEHVQLPSWPFFRYIYTSMFYINKFLNQASPPLVPVLYLVILDGVHPAGLQVAHLQLVGQESIFLRFDPVIVLTSVLAKL